MRKRFLLLFVICLALLLCFTACDIKNCRRNPATGRKPSNQGKSNRQTAETRQAVKARMREKRMTENRITSLLHLLPARGCSMRFEMTEMAFPLLVLVFARIRKL